jgi:hypothetical protein
MITTKAELNQQTIACLQACDPVVNKYRSFFISLQWQKVAERGNDRVWPGKPPHPEIAYIKALLVKINEKKAYMTELRTYLVEHPLLVLELGFLPVRADQQPYGFDVERTVPTARWLSHKGQTIDHQVLRGLFEGSVQMLEAELPMEIETAAIDTKHIYAWVRENNPRENIPNRYDPKRQPRGDNDCSLGVKRHHNREEAEGTKQVKEYLWGYGSGVIAATHPLYGDIVLAEHTLPFNEADVSYYQPLHQQMQETLKKIPPNFTGDAAFDAWFVYQPPAVQGGLAAIPLNLRGFPEPQLGPNGHQLCPHNFEMIPSYIYFDVNRDHHVQILRCPLLHPQPTGISCSHEQFAKGIGCEKRINHELGGRMRVALDRRSDAYKAIYRQRTSAERINSQAKAYGIERPRVRNINSVRNLNTLIYIVINVHALRRVREINKSLLC